MTDKFYKFISTGFFSGYLPWAPGTWGTVVGVVIFWFIGYLAPLHYMLLLAVLTALAIWSSSHAIRIYKDEDPSCVVIDEIVGYLVTMAFHDPSLAAMIIGFFLFRLFDITKLFPVSWFEKRFPGGFGIVMDDVMAGVYANVALFLIAWILSFAGIVI